MDLPACWIMDFGRDDGVDAVTAGGVIPRVAAEVLVFAMVLPSDR